MKSRLVQPASRVLAGTALMTSALVVGGNVPSTHAAVPVPDIAQKVAVPAYINPLLDPNAWAQLATSSPAAMGFAVANVINGPDYVPFEEWSQVMQSVSASGVKVVGYVDTGYLGTTGQRTRLGSTDPADWMSQIQHDVDAWYRFYGSSSAASSSTRPRTRVDQPRVRTRGQTCTSGSVTTSNVSTRDLSRSSIRASRYRSATRPPAT